MCHGTPRSSELWVPFAGALAQDFTVYLWDMPRYGKSSKDAAHDVDLGVQGDAFAVLHPREGPRRRVCTAPRGRAPVRH